MAYNNKTFKSMNGTTLRVTLPSGGVALIPGDEWIELPPEFHQGAYAAGAISSDMLANVAKDIVDAGLAKTLTSVATKKDDIRTTIMKWIDENDVDKFAKIGNSDVYKPKVQALTDALGKRVFKEERDEVWSNIQQEGLEAPRED